jgi:hypothetical protein
LRGQPADPGILGCSDPDYICVEDELSSLGGRCAPRAVAGRELQHTPPCTSKCSDNGCTGLSQAVINNIGANSCCGEKACVGITGERMSCLRDNCFHCTLSIIFCIVLLSQTDTNVTIGPNSCIGMKACYKIKNGKCIACVSVESTVFSFNSAVDFPLPGLAQIGKGSCTGDSIQGYFHAYGHSCAFLQG